MTRAIFMRWLLIATCVWPVAVAAQQTGSLVGVVRAERTGAAIAGATLRIPARDRETLSDSAGAFSMEALPAGRLRLVATAPGFRPYSVVIRVPRDATLRLDIELAARVQSLPRQDVRAQRQETAEEQHTRELFERNVVPGTTTISRAEMRALPTLVEPDLLRSLQSLPGMVAINDLDAQLYVRGGNADQNLFLLDGAPVFGAYHIFGMNGVFNSSAVETVDFFRGMQPARFGGALSSVVAIEQLNGDVDATEAGISALGARLMHRAQFAGDRVRLMVAARRTITDIFAFTTLPFGFYDAQSRLDWHPGWGHEITLSGLASADRFHMFFGGGDGELRSRWTNAVGSLRWTTPRWRGWTATSALWSSNYAASIRVGVDQEAPLTADRVLDAGARLGLERGVLGASVRMGAEVDRVATRLEGEEVEGTYYSGTAWKTVARGSGYVDAERVVGPLRFAPGVRVARAPGGATLLEPRIGVRAHLAAGLSLTVGASRDHQFLSTLRDARTVLPGPPLWFIHPDGAPVSRGDALVADLTAWVGRGWSWTLGAYDRRFRDVPHWRPEGVRDLSSVSYDDGSARGIELGVRRFGERVGGWLGYAFNRTRFTDARTGEEYASIADRRHAMNAAVMYRPTPGLAVSAQAAYGTGLPFWPFVGDLRSPNFAPFEVMDRGFTTTRSIEVWASRQLRMPQYARLDLGVRRPFQLRGATVEPFLSVHNATARPNVVYYELDPPGNDEPTPTGIPSQRMLRPVRMPWTILPTIGLDVRF